MFWRKILTLFVFSQAAQSARPWMGCVATVVYKFLRAEPRFLSSALTPNP